MGAVILGAMLAGAAGVAGLLVGAGPLHAQAITQQYGRKAVDKGPRALGLVLLSSTGKARIIPIAIMMDGKFYDASSYKATPVPMALDFGIVYEGFRTGVSQGLFTITQPGQLNHNWIAEGTWLPAGAIAEQKAKKYAPPVIDQDERDDRPTLHRRKGGEADKDEAKPASGGGATTGTIGSVTPPSQTPSPSGTSSGPTPSTSGSPGPAGAPSSSPSSTSTTPTSAGAGQAAPSTGSTTSPAKEPEKSAPASGGKTSDSSTTKTASARRSSEYDQPIDDPNRPILRRGKPDPNAHHEPFVNFDEPSEMAKATAEANKESAAAAAAAAASVQTFTAISDAGGPDPRPYTYDVKPAEEAIYRNKMFELAAQQMQPKGQQGAASTASKNVAAGSSKGSAAKKSAAVPAKPQFDDAKLRIFDLSSSNEPILVLSARTPIPPASASGSAIPKEITLIARTDLEGELQKLYFAQTDARHLDVKPRMELIDAVDADGDGRGELLFRQTSDEGSSYAIYRVTADGLWPLFEGTP